MNPSYSSSTATDVQEYDSANPPPLSSGQTPPATEVPWSTGLFSCFDDCPNCCITCCCPCITFGQISEIVDEGVTTCGANAAIYTLIGYFTGWMGMCCYSCLYRTKMRKQYMLSESPCPDCCVHCFCESCALCQEYRELKNRGFDMSKGWKGNLERQNHGITMAPVVEGMSK